MTDSVAHGVKRNRRLVTFGDNDIQAFYDHIRGLYDSEASAWLHICPRTSWKYDILLTENQIRRKARRLREMEAALAREAELW